MGVQGRQVRGRHEGHGSRHARRLRELERERRSPEHEDGPRHGGGLAERAQGGVRRRDPCQHTPAGGVRRTRGGGMNMGYEWVYKDTVYYDYTAQDMVWVMLDDEENEDEKPGLSALLDALMGTSDADEEDFDEAEDDEEDEADEQDEL